MGEEKTFFVESTNQNWPEFLGRRRAPESRFVRGRGGGGRRSKTNLHQGVLIFLECLNMRKAYLLERADRCTSSVSVGFSKPDTAGPCIVLHSSDRPKHQQVPEPEAETLACLPRCQRKEKSPVTTDTMGRATKPLKANYVLFFSCTENIRLGPSQ